MAEVKYEWHIKRDVAEKVARAIESKLSEQSIEDFEEIPLDEKQNVLLAAVSIGLLVYEREAWIRVENGKEALVKGRRYLTHRQGELGVNICTYIGEGEWSEDSTGRDTIANPGTFAHPTHFREIPPVPQVAN